MARRTRQAAIVAIVLLPTIAAAQDDVAYCRALASTYQRYVVKMDTGHTMQSGPLDARLALEQCRAGNTAGIPVLEQSLRDARVDLPPRG